MVVCRPRSRGRCTYTARDEPAFQRLGALLRRWYKSMQAGCDLDRYDACPKHLTLPSLNLPIHRCRSLSASTTVAVHNKLPARIAGRSTHAVPTFVAPDPCYALLLFTMASSAVDIASPRSKQPDLPASQQSPLAVSTAKESTTIGAEEDTTQEDDLDPAAFLKSVRELSERREKEDNERVRRLEEEIEKGRQKRLARRAEGEFFSQRSKLESWVGGE